MATEPALMAEVRARFAAREGFALATINLDHLVKLAKSSAFAKAYAAQDLICADGNPIVWLSRLAGKPLTLMPGSDLVIPLARLAADEGASVALVGSTEDALAGAAADLSAKVPGLKIAYTKAPPMGFDPEGAEAEAILQEVHTAGAQLCFLALGAPKQEQLAAFGRRIAPGTGFASIGAGLDFLAGHQTRAPRWMRRLALEWVWRMLSSPRRLLPRYAQCIAILPAHIGAALRQRRTSWRTR
ncbi:MAG: WecB/TagA/CpsF family glycosyltransferase [Pseudomonadota bacterium]